MLLLMRRAFAVVVGLVSTVTIAHLVSPREFGLANMSAVILSFAQIFRDFGLTNAVLRKGTISQAEMSFIFWFNAATTTALCLLIALVSPFAGAFYHEPLVPWVILASLIGFLLSGLALQHRAMMNRELRFAELAWIDSAAILLGFLTTLVLAIIWHDVWSIVIGTIVQSASGSLLFVIRSGWRPNRPAVHDEIRDLLQFGANTSIFSISVFLSQNAAPIIIGHALGPWSLGQFNRAQALFTIPTVNVIQPITQATMPLMARLRAVPEEYRQAYLGLVSRICTILMPASVVLTFGATALVEVLLGQRWAAAGQVLAALSPALAAIGLGYSIGDLFATQNRSAELRTLGLIEMALRLGCLSLAVRYGLFAAAIGFSVTASVVALLRLLVAGRTGPVSTADQFRAAAPGLAPAIGAAIAIILFMSAAHGLPRSIWLSLEIIAGGVGALAGALPFAASRLALLDVASAFGLPQLIARARRHRAVQL